MLTLPQISMSVLAELNFKLPWRNPRGMNDAIRKAVTDALIDPKLGSSMERLDRRISTITEKVTELENCLPNEEDMGGNNTDEDVVFDEDGNIDAATTRAERLRCRLRENKRGMGGPRH